MFFFDLRHVSAAMLLPLMMLPLSRLICCWCWFLHFSCLLFDCFLRHAMLIVAFSFFFRCFLFFFFFHFIFLFSWFFSPRWYFAAFATMLPFFWCFLFYLFYFRFLYRRCFDYLLMPPIIFIFHFLDAAFWYCITCFIDYLLCHDDITMLIISDYFDAAMIFRCYAFDVMPFWYIYFHWFAIFRLFICHFSHADAAISRHMLLLIFAFDIFSDAAAVSPLLLMRHFRFLRHFRYLIFFSCHADAWYYLIDAFDYFAADADTSRFISPCRFCASLFWFSRFIFLDFDLLPLLSFDVIFSQPWLCFRCQLMRFLLLIFFAIFMLLIRCWCQMLFDDAILTLMPLLLYFRFVYYFFSPMLICCWYFLPLWFSFTPAISSDFFTPFSLMLFLIRCFFLRLGDFDYRRFLWWLMRFRFRYADYFHWCCRRCYRRWLIFATFLHAISDYADYDTAASIFSSAAWYFLCRWYLLLFVFWLLILLAFDFHFALFRWLFRFRFDIDYFTIFRFLMPLILLDFSMLLSFRFCAVDVSLMLMMFSLLLIGLCFASIRLWCLLLPYYFADAVFAYFSAFAAALLLCCRWFLSSCRYYCCSLSFSFRYVAYALFFLR